MSVMAAQKNNDIELWRFYIFIGVAVMHLGYYNGFYIAVDFFFMLSGFLIAHSIRAGGKEQSGSSLFSIR